MAINAQEFDVIDNAIWKIERLVEYNQNDDARKGVDSLLQVLENHPKRQHYLEQRLQLMLLNARMYERLAQDDQALPILLTIVDQAKAKKLHHISCHSHLILALIYEKQRTADLAKYHLNAADKIRKEEQQLEEFYSRILIRRSLYHRRFNEDLDSAMFYARKAYEYAVPFGNEYDMMDASLLMGLYENAKGNYQEALKHFPKAAAYYLKVNNVNEGAMMYRNIALSYVNMDSLRQAKHYNDTAYAISAKTFPGYRYYITKQRAELFEKMNQPDSAYFYLKMNRDIRESIIKEEESAAIKKITEQYNNDQKEAVIRSKDQQLLFIICLLTIIGVAAAFLMDKNRKINSQNKIINRQLEELMKALEQKQMLLSELQHRVKNNLQHVISILEIQKESVDFNNIEELIRGNQNRIHSMALLHKKLAVSDDINEVDLVRYVNELSELVKESYDNSKRKINLVASCDIQTMSIEKALPLGLIIVELVSNSMKHAFKKRSTGIIHIGLSKDIHTKENKLWYADNGIGFEFSRTSEKGLGMEIIKGLIHQLDGRIDTDNSNGFELCVYFN